MSRVALAVLAAGAACLAWPFGATAAAAGEAVPPAVAISTGPASLPATIGDTVTITSTARNNGSAATGPMIAHLDVVSLSPEVYVDPEDWSSQRSVDVQPLPAGGATTLSWPVRTVDAGDFAAYVVLVPADPTGPGELVPSVPVHLTVTGRRTLDPGGTLPVVLGVPAAVLLAVSGPRLRRRVRRPADR